jgi:flagellar basal-body rod protein FlgG
MNDALYVAATGLFAHQSNVETIANNVANIGTPAFKRSRVQFQDLLARPAADGAAGVPGAGGSAVPSAAIPLAGGRGVGVSAAQVARVFESGELRSTGAPMDLAIQGDGFIEVLLPDGATALTRGGSLQVGADGALQSAEGYPLKAGIVVPPDAGPLVISRTGLVTVAGRPGEAAHELGQIELVVCSDPQSLQPLGGGLYRAPDEGARLVAVTAGEAGAGTLAQGFVESANVRMADEMVALMVAQRAYEMNAKVMQAADEMMGISNNLRRG